MDSRTESPRNTPAGPSAKSVRSLAEHDALWRRYPDGHAPNLSLLVREARTLELSLDELLALVLIEWRTQVEA